MSTWPTRTQPIKRAISSFCAALVIFQTTVPVAHVRAHPTHPGKWTGTRNLGGTAVNLVLLPGGPSAFHSRVLWWDHDSDNPIAGNIIGWNAPNDTTTNTGTFPLLPNFRSMGLEDPPLLHGEPSNIFCAGQVMLADGRLLVTGGTDHGEVGSVSTLYFNPAADSNGSWARTDDMAYRRWYDDNVLLPNSQVLTTSGSTYAHYLTVGGFADAAPDSRTRMLQRVGIAVDCTIEPSVVPLKAATPASPLANLSDASGLLVSSNRLLVYGGRDNVPAKTMLLISFLANEMSTAQTMTSAGTTLPKLPFSDRTSRTRESARRLSKSGTRTICC